MHRYTTYPEYKPSDGNWIGDIPVGWEVKRLKFLLTEPLKYGANESAELSDTDLPRYIRITDVKDDGSLRAETFRSLPEDIAKPYLLDEGDILLARSGATVGKTFIYRKPWGRAAFAGYLIRARTNRNILNADFAYYFLQSSVYWQWLNSVSIQATIQNVSAEKYASLFIPLPDLSQQRIIARFLDFKTAQIDTLIAKKQSLLEKLAEKRTALISRAVTKGLDPSVTMKDSGVEWLGEIPAHWEVIRLRHCIEFLTSGSRGWAEYFAEEGSLFLRITNVTRDSIKLKLEDVQYVSPPDGAEGRRTATLPGDVVISITADLGSVAVIPDSVAHAYVSQHLALLRPKQQKTSGNWMAYQVFSLSGKAQLLGAGYGGSKIQLGLGDVKDVWIALPSTAEQNQISQQLDLLIGKWEIQIVKVKSAIDALTEYRSALITNAVTGKIDVRDFQIPKPVADIAS